MKRYLAIVLAALIAGAGYALAQVSNPTTLNSGGCTYAGCTQNYTQNGIQSFVKTYKWAQAANTPAASGTDILTINGSATKTIRVTRIVVSGQATGQGNSILYVLKRSTADQGGTASTPTAAPLDSNNTAATGMVSIYTANPSTLGTLVGTLDTCRLFLTGPATTGAPDVCSFTYGVNDDQVAVLRGTSQSLAVSLNAQSVVTGGVLDFDVEWTEEP